jgi:dethiobiotin synthetase
MGHSYYVTGTDTGVGKTWVSVALLQALRLAGTSAVGMKPVASGCTHEADGWRNADALALQAASAPRPDYALVNPFALPAATAPSIAAALAGIEVTLPPLLTAYRALAASAEAVVVEGVGGWLAPLGADLEQAQLAAALGLPVILVVGLKLGCLNHARLSERAIVADGLHLAGWIGNAIDPELEYSRDYLALLQEALQAPCLGCLPHAPEHPAASFAATLRLPDSD